MTLNFAFETQTTAHSMFVGKRKASSELVAAREQRRKKDHFSLPIEWVLRAYDIAQEAIRLTMAERERKAHLTAEQKQEEERILWES